MLPESPPAEGPPLLVPAEELARLLAVSTWTLHRLRLTGEIPPPLKIGRSARWRMDEVRSWIDRGCPSNN